MDQGFGVIGKLFSVMKYSEFSGVTARMTHKDWTLKNIHFISYSNSKVMTSTHMKNVHGYANQIKYISVHFVCSAFSSISIKIHHLT